jgi:hypothetical protein
MIKPVINRYTALVQSDGNGFAFEIITYAI